MKVLGSITFPEKFEWTPSQLLAMIRETDKVCPDTQQTDIGHLNKSGRAYNGV
jgi:hypothetical protein